MSIATPTFPNRSGAAFHAELKKLVAAHFEERNLSTRGGIAMIIKTALLLSLIFVPYAVILSQSVPPVVMLALAAVIGVGIAGVGFAVSHDALHGAYSENSRVNTIVGWSMDLVGGSSYLWKITHNIIHHTYTNIHGTDEDLAVSPLLRLSPHAQRHWFHRLQHWYALVLYSMTSMFWVFVKDYKYLLARDIGPYENKHHKPADVVGLILGKVVFYGWSVVIPFLVLDLAWWQVTLGIVVAHLVAGTALGIVFQLAHVVEATAHPEPGNDAAMDDSWVAHELATTANFAPRNRLLTWYVGGLNYQVEHHLFPRICSKYYPELSPIVAKLAAEYGLPYHSNSTLLSAFRSHLRTLKAFGLPVGEPATEAVSAVAA